MAMTRAEWEALQRRLPVEDRTTYEEYLASLGLNVSMNMASERYTAMAQAAGLTPKTTTNKINPASIGIDPMDVRDPVTGLTPAQVAAKAALNEAVAAGAALGIQTKQNVATPGNVPTVTITGKPSKPVTKTETRREYIGSGPGRILRIYYSDGTTQDFPAPETTIIQPPPSTSSVADLLSIIQSLQNTIANLSSKPAVDAAAEKAARDLEARQSAFDLLYSEMDALGLAALVEPLRGLIQKGVSPSEFAVELRQSEAYKARFIANDARLKKGLRVLSPREYLAVEDAYRQTLRTYGLRQFDNDEYVRQFIENDISAAELSDRVAMAVQRVQNADPAISRTLRDYYGIGQNDLVAYVLDPNQQLQKIQRQIAAAEIGTAARVQGIEAGVGVSEQLAAQGITQAQAQKGYATIADILPTAEKLSQIYGTTLEGYDIAQAEQEVFNQLASAQRRRERLTQREIAAFSGQSGLGRTSLTGETRGQF